MAYSTSEKTLRKIEHLFKPLLEPNSAGALFIAQEARGHPARELAYKLREGMWIARECHPEKFPELAAVADKFRFVIRSRTSVEAVPRSGPQQYETAPVLRTTVNGDSNNEAVRVVNGKQTADTIVSEWKDSARKAVYMGAQLDYEELTRLWRWCSARGKALYEMEGIVTIISQPTPDELEFAWTPEESNE